MFLISFKLDNGKIPAAAAGNIELATCYSTKCANCRPVSNGSIANSHSRMSASVTRRSSTPAARV